jgi:uncharacterized damage-inducible protein DinB
MLAELLELYAYNRWAHERILASVAPLTAEQYTRSLGSSFPTLRATLEHLLRAEIAWLARWKGEPRGPAPDLVECTDVSLLSARWIPHWDEQKRFLETLDESGLRRPVEIRLWSGIEAVQPLADTMRHVVNHATYHRGQATTMTRQLGGSPASTDFFMYCLLRDTGQLAALSS